MLRLAHSLVQCVFYTISNWQGTEGSGFGDWTLGKAKNKLAEEDLN
jgi:hypothetical protein